MTTHRDHDRTPVMPADDNAREWLRGAEIDHALSLLKPLPAEFMEGYHVSKLVNNPQNDSPDCKIAVS